MRLQSVSNYNSYQQPTFQGLIVRPKTTSLFPQERLLGLEEIIKNNKSLQEYAKVLEERAEQFGLPKVDLIAEYGKSSSGYGNRCVDLMTSDKMYPSRMADEGDYTIPVDERSVYNQMEKFDCSHIVNAYRNGYSIKEGLMKNYLA